MEEHVCEMWGQVSQLYSHWLLLIYHQLNAFPKMSKAGSFSWPAREKQVLRAVLNFSFIGTN